MPDCTFLYTKHPFEIQIPTQAWVYARIPKNPPIYSVSLISHPSSLSLASKTDGASSSA